MAPEPPQPNQTPKYSLIGGGGYNPQIQGDTRVYGGGLINMGSCGGLINMGSFCGGGGMGLPVLILVLLGIVRAYFYFVVRKGAPFRFSWNPSREPPEPPQPTQTTEYSQTGGSLQGVNIADGGGHINMGPVSGGGGMGLQIIIRILGLFEIVWAYFYLVVRKGARFRFSWNPSREPPEPPQPTQTTEYSQIGGGGNNPQIQGDNRVYGGERQIGGGGNNPQIHQGNISLGGRQIGGGGNNPQIQGDNRVYGGERQIGGGGNNPQIQGNISLGGRKIGGGGNNPQIQGNISLGGMRLRDSWGTGP